MLPENLIATYGYVALFLGTIIEGESFLIAAAFLAGYGYMNFPEIFLVAVAGAVTGDQSFLFFSRSIQGPPNSTKKAHLESAC